MTSKRRKISIIHIIPTLSQGGAESLLVQLVNTKKSDIKHYIFTFIKEKEIFYKPNCELISINLRVNPFIIFDLYNFVRKIKEINPEIIHGWLYYGNLLTVFLKIFINKKIIWSIHNTDLSKRYSRKFLRFSNLLCKYFSYFIPEKIIYCSQTSLLHHNKIGYFQKKNIIINNGINIKKFFQDPKLKIDLRNKYQIKKDEIVIGCIARYSKQKDFKTLVDAFSRFNNKVKSKLVLVGNKCSRDNKELFKLLKKFNILNHVLLLGLRDDIVEILNLLDLVVLSSAFGEAMSLSILEAAYSGKNIIVTDVGSSFEICLDPKLIAQKKSSKSFLNALLYANAIMNTKYGDSLVKERQELIRNFYDIDKNNNKYFDLYRGFID